MSEKTPQSNVNTIRLTSMIDVHGSCSKPFVSLNERVTHVFAASLPSVSEHVYVSERTSN